MPERMPQNSNSQFQIESPIEFKIITPIKISHAPFRPEKYWEFLLVWVNIFQKECKMHDKRTRLMFSIDTWKP